MSFAVQKCFLALAALLQLVNHALKVRIAGAEASGEPVSAALCDGLAISQQRKFARLAGRNHGIDSEPFLNQGCETRSFGFVALSRRAGAYLNVHLFSKL